VAVFKTKDRQIDKDLIEKKFLRFEKINFQRNFEDYPECKGSIHFTSRDLK
jgi:hypothetical protein